MELDLMFLKKTPPHSLEAEKTVLGGILVNNKNLNVVLSIIIPEDFYTEAHRTILQKITTLVDKGLPADLLSITEGLQKSGHLDEVGGATYVSSLMDGVPRSLNIEYHTQTIKEKALLRRLILSSADTISRSYEQKEDADQILDEAQAGILEVAEKRIQQGFIHIGSMMDSTIGIVDAHRKKKDAVTGVPAGFRDLDALTSGFHGSEFVVVAARPSMGKTAMCLNISQHVGTKCGKSVGFFSLEMAKEQLVLRMLCGEAQIDLKKARTGFISDREFERLKLAGNVLSQAKLFVDETPALSVMEMKAKSRRLKMEHSLDIIFVDYIQLMRVGGEV